MFKTKIAVIAMAGMLAMCVGLTACGGSASSSSAASGSASASSAASSSTAAASSTASSSETAASSTAASTAASSTAASSKILYWEGELSDGTIVCYRDDATVNEAVLCVIKSDFSDATMWLGSSSSSEEGVVTVTDAESKKTISYVISDITPDLFTIDLEGYGVVELKPVSEAEFKAFATKLAASSSISQRLTKGLGVESEKVERKIAIETRKLMKELEGYDDATVLFWDGYLADGRAVSYMDDPESGKAFLGILKANLSDGAAWYGTYTTDQDGKVITITDDESKATVTCEVLETTPGTSMKMNIEQYGEAEFKSITKADFVQFVEQVSALSDQSATK